MLKCKVFTTEQDFSCAVLQQVQACGCHKAAPMNARIKVLEALARQAETLRASPDHEVAAEAASWAADLSRKIATERRKALAQEPQEPVPLAG